MLKESKFDKKCIYIYIFKKNRRLLPEWRIRCLSMLLRTDLTDCLQLSMKCHSRHIRRYEGMDMKVLVEG